MNSQNFVRQVRTFDDLFDNPNNTRPAGLAFSSRSQRFLSINPQSSGQTAIEGINTSEDRVSTFNLPASIKPINTAFDDKFNRLLGLNTSGDRLIEVKADTSGNLLPNTLREIDIKAFGIQNAKGVTVASDGTLYVLDGAANKIVRIQPAADGGLTGASVSAIALPPGITNVQGIAFNSSTSRFQVLDPTQRKLYEISQTGGLIATRDLSGLGLKNPQSLVFAPSGDSTDNAQQLSLYVADSDPTSGGIMELSLTAPMIIQETSTPVVLPLVRTTDLSTFPCPDPAGITYNPVLNQLVISDSEINEMPNLFTGSNIFFTTLTGSLVSTARTTNFSNEPTGISYVASSNRYYVSDDDAKKISLVNPPTTNGGPLSLVSQFVTTGFGSNDPEGVTLAPDLGHLFIADGLNAEVYRVTTSGTLVSQFDTASLGVFDPEAIVYDPDTQHLFIGGLLANGQPSNRIAEVTITGTLVRMLDISAANTFKVAGFTLGPSSNNPNAKSIYIVDRGVDNNDNPNENDGKLYEFSLEAPNQAPTLNSFNLTLSEGGTVVLAGSNINITDPDSSSFTYTASSVTGGNFQTLNGGNWTNATSFTTAQIDAGQVRFVHDGGETAPSFQVTANDGAANSNTIAGTVSFTNVNDAPTLNSVSLTVSEGSTVILAGSDFNLTDPDSSSFTYTVSSVTGGNFQTLNGGNWSNATSFTTAQVNAGEVRFAHSGTVAPTFQIQANDGAAVNNLSNLINGTVNFTNINDPPTLNSFSLTVSEGGTVVLAGANIDLTDPDSTAFTYTASSVTGGNFQTLNGGNWTNATSFTTAQIDAGEVRFLHNGGETAPSFQVTANDGALDSNTIAGTVSFTNVNDAPTLNSVSFSIAQGGTTVLTPANLNITDPDSTAFTYTANSVTGGSFQTTSNGTNWTNATSFTSAQVSAGQVRFAHSGTVAPTFQIQANDGAAVNNLSEIIDGTVNFTSIPDPPTLNSFSLTVSEGGTVVLAGANIDLTDPDSTAFTYTASSVTGGNFQTTSNGTTWTNATSFTTAQVSAGQVRFAHSGEEAAPSFQVTANDGTANSNTIAGTVSFTNVNDAPVLNSVSFSVAQGETTVLTPANLNITDPDSTAFTYTASSVTGGSFQTTSNGTTWTNATSFTSAQVSAGQVRFAHSGTVAPTFQIQANDGAAVNNLSNTINGSVSVTQPFSTIYVSLNGNGTVGGISFSDEDILAFNTATQTWSMYFDGSDVGLGSFDVEAFHITSNGSILLALNNATTLPGAGSVDDSDIVSFTPTSTGNNTAGTFQLYFDGSDVGLTTNSEEIDAIALTPDGRLVISTNDSFSVTGVSGNDEDLIVFNSTSLGSTTSGTWSMYFDGSDVSLNQSSNEDVDGAWIHSNGEIYLSTLGSFSVTGLNGDGNDIFRFTPSSTGSNTSGNYAALWDGTAFGLGSQNVDSFFLV
jgi:Cadherin-like